LHGRLLGVTSFLRIDDDETFIGGVIHLERLDQRRKVDSNGAVINRVGERTVFTLMKFELRPLWFYRIVAGAQLKGFLIQQDFKIPCRSVFKLEAVDVPYEFLLSFGHEQLSQTNDRLALSKIAFFNLIVHNL
jgi:hypothetical protein